jgi:MFS family permease
MYDSHRTMMTIRKALMTPPSDNSRPFHPRATLLLSCLAQFMVILDVSVVNVALPAIRGGLHFSEVDLLWVVNAYTVSCAGLPAARRARRRPAGPAAGVRGGPRVVRAGVARRRHL